jgi:hypothetical protein
MHDAPQDFLDGALGHIDETCHASGRIQGDREAGVRALKDSVRTTRFIALVLLNPRGCLSSAGRDAFGMSRRNAFARKLVQFTHEASFAVWLRFCGVSVVD